MAKLRSMWDYGIFVGVRPRSNETWVATAERTWKVRSVRRLPEDVRWSSDSVKWVRRSTDTLVVALAVEAVSVVWASGHTRQNAAKDSES